MKIATLALALAFALALALAPALPARALELGTLTGAWSARGTEEVAVDFPVGHLAVVAGDDDSISVVLEVRCSHGGRRCIERSRRLRIVAEQVGERRRIRVEGYPKFGSRGLRLELRVAVPRRTALDLDVGVGSLDIRGVAGDVAVEMGVGEATIHVPEHDVRSVRATVGVGSADLKGRGLHVDGQSFISSRLHWSDGPGSARVSLHLGVGDANVRLD